MNKFQFLGRLIKDVEQRETTTGTKVSLFTLAVNRKYNNEEAKADFFNCTAFGKTAEFVAKYFQKGRQVLVEGRIQNRAWEDTTGARRYATDYIVVDTYFADSKNTSENGANKEDNGDYITIDDTNSLPF